MSVKLLHSGRVWPTVVDVFAGCGGVTEGLKRRNFRIVAAVENDPIVCQTYRLNHPRVHLLEKNVEKVSVTGIRREVLGDRDVDLLVVCAPCQPFSSQNRARSIDPRADLILQSVRFARILKPKVILFENVPGLARIKFLSILDQLRQGLGKCGYVLGEPQEVDAADYGVPQRRIRCLMLAVKGGMPPSIPAPHTPVGYRQTVRDAFKGLTSLMSGENDECDRLHFARSHKSIALQRLKHIPKDGGSRKSLPTRLELPCHRDRRGYPDVYGRMSWSKVAPTLTTGCTDITKGRFVHPSDDRAISLREAARLQTFPDKYQFAGNHKQMAAQIGNAVPVELIKALSPMLRAAIRSR